MQITADNRGLYIFNVDVYRRDNIRKFNCLIDTGSTECAATYRVITTLQLKRPRYFEKASMINNITDTQCLLYHPRLVFNNQKENTSLYRPDELPSQLLGKSQIIPLYRFNELTEGIDLLLGMSFLSQFKMIFHNNILTIE